MAGNNNFILVEHNGTRFISTFIFNNGILECYSKPFLCVSPWNIDIVQFSPLKYISSLNFKLKTLFEFFTGNLMADSGLEVHQDIGDVK